MGDVALIDTPAAHGAVLHRVRPGHVAVARKTPGGWKETAHHVGELPDVLPSFAGEADVYLSTQRFHHWRRIAYLAEMGALAVDVDFHKIPAMAGSHPLGALEDCLVALERARIPAPSIAMASGRGVVDIVREEIRELGKRGPRIKLWPVNATAGFAGRVTVSGGFINVPKKDLVIAAVVALQDGRLKIGDVPSAKLLTDELAEYRMKLTSRQNQTFEAGGRNDDLAFACFLACWAWSHTRSERREDRRRATPRSEQDSF